MHFSGKLAFILVIYIVFGLILTPDFNSVYWDLSESICLIFCSLILKGFILDYIGTV